MFEQLVSAPAGFWLVIGVLALLITEGFLKWNEPWAKPALTVYGTIGIWYPGDYILAESVDFQEFSDWTLEFSFLQVASVLVLLRMIFPIVVERLARGMGLGNLEVHIDEVWLKFILTGAIFLWCLLLAIGIFRLSAEWDFDKQWPALFWPPLYPDKVSMFGHGGIGDSTTFIFALLSYVQRLNCAVFGVVAVVGTGKIRYVAMIMIALSWPYIFFDRMRNVMLSVLLPGFAAFWISSKRKLLFKAAVTFFVFMVVDYWFKVVLVYRGEYNMTAFSSQGTENVKHHGLDMLKELCFINTFIETGHYSPNWGVRYFAELVNFVPRAVWPGKPTIGIDYAIARGFADSASDMGINVTVATGLVGQGVVNFGPYLGCIAVAYLLSLWIGFLSRLWIQRRSAARLLLFYIGLGVTFNCGRDISFLILFPFVVGYVFVRLWEKFGVGTLKSIDNNLPNQPAGLNPP